MPSGVDELEVNALDVVRSNDNRSVIAGPGAGKTELLAQRAAFLLQTGMAPAPRRILAISFKRDAAANLADRVRKRCHSSHAGRLDSMTFDAFAKGLLDRFGQALPARWRPKPDFEILYPDWRLYRDFLEREIGEPPVSVGTYADLQALSAKSFERSYLVAEPLLPEGWSHPTPAQWASDRFWQRSIHRSGPSQLSFPMIGRLVELMLRTNPVVRDAVRLTYSHLFLDEFQDTTNIQYDLVRTIFLGSNTVITAVGDNKQQIMRWAMAMDDPFGAYEADFKAVRTPLYNNYRSSRELVSIQHVLAKALDARSAEPISKSAGSISGESSAILRFSTPQREAVRLASLFSSEMRKYELGPRDFVLLVRQKPGDYAEVLAPAFADAGIPLRNEAAMIGSIMLQDLLAEPVSRQVLGILRLATAKRSGRYWAQCQKDLIALHAVESEDSDAQARITNELDEFARDFGLNHPLVPADKAEARQIVDLVVDFIGHARLLTSYPAYGHGGWLEKILESISEHLLASAEGLSRWSAVLDRYEGTHAVPLMTIHKSKGLEYHTVAFVGLDDGAWWSFSNDETEATAAFFVAFTRAKQRVFFTYCRQRGDRQAIAKLYDLLKRAGVGEVDAD